MSREGRYPLPTEIELCVKSNNNNNNALHAKTVKLCRKENQVLTLQFGISILKQNRKAIIRNVVFFPSPLFFFFLRSFPFLSLMVGLLSLSCPSTAEEETSTRRTKEQARARPNPNPNGGAGRAIAAI